MVEKKNDAANLTDSTISNWNAELRSSVLSGEQNFQTPPFLTFMAEAIRTLMMVTSVLEVMHISWQESDGTSLKDFDLLTVIAKYLRDKTDGYQLLTEVLVCRAVDNFQCYLADVLRAVFAARPETLKSRQKVEIAEVLECGTIGEFADRVAERKTEELTYSGLAGIKDFITEGLGVSIQVDDSCEHAASQAVLIRNLYVHNRGRVNHRFLRLTGRNDLKKGDLISVDLQQQIASTKALQSYAKAIDEALVSKFRKEFLLHFFNSEAEK